MRILVTGGGWFLGSHIVKRLYRRGDKVRVVGRRDYSGLPNEVELFKGDLCDSSVAMAACEGCDAVFHVAAMPKIWGKKEEFYSSNVVATLNIIEACCRQGTQKLIYTSSPSVVFGGVDLENANESLPYPEKYLSEYAKTKAIAERLVIEANSRKGLLTVCIRPHLIWGPGDPHLIPSILKRARKGKLAQIGAGKNKVDITYIDNAVEAHLKAYEALEEGSPIAGQCYFISDGEPVVLWDWINLLLREMNIPPVRKKISRRMAYVTGAMLEIVYRILNLSGEPRMTRFLATQLADSHYFDIARAKKEFGYKAVTTPEEGIRRLKEFFIPHEAN